MKKGLALLMSFMMLFSITACSSGDNSNDSDGQESGRSDSGDPIVIKAVSQQSETSLYWDFVQAYCKEVEAWSGGMVTIDLLGSTETIAESEMIYAVQNGIIDMYFDMETLSQLTPMGTAMALSGMTPWEERQNGVYDFLQDFYARETNLHWIGKSNLQWWVLCTKNPCPTRESISSMKIRANGPCAPIVDAMGAVTTEIPFSDIYQSLESNVIDGFILCPEGIVVNNLHEQTNYMLNLPMFTGSQASLLMNMDKWNSLTDEQKSYIEGPFENLEKMFYAFYYYNQKTGEESAINHGLELVNWTEEEKAAVTEDIRNTMWNSLKDGIPEEDAKKFAELVGLSY